MPYHRSHFVADHSKPVSECCLPKKRLWEPESWVQRDLWYDFIWDACRAIYGPVNESCRLSRCDANCTHPLKSSLPFVFVYLPPQQKKKRWTWQKGGKCRTQTETMIKPCTLLGQRGEREDQPPSPRVSLPVTLSEIGHILKYPCGKDKRKRRSWYHAV